MNPARRDFRLLVAAIILVILLLNWRDALQGIQDGWNVKWD